MDARRRRSVAEPVGEVGGRRRGAPAAARRGHGLRRLMPPTERIDSPLDGETRRLAVGRLDAVAAQHVAHDPGEDRAGDRAAAAVDLGCVDHDVDGEAGVVGRGEAAEGDGGAAVVAAALGVDALRGAGLAGDEVARDLGAPARRRPRGRRPSPSSSRSPRAACLLTTRVRVATSVPTVTPSSVTAEPEIRLGETRTPPLAIVFTAAAIWSDVDRQRLAEGDAVLGLRGHHVAGR